MRIPLFGEVEFGSVLFFGEEEAGAELTLLSLNGIGSAEAFGGLVVDTQQSLLLSGIPGAEAFGTIAVNYGNLTISLSGVVGGEVFGTVRLNSRLTLTGVTSAEAFGMLRAALLAALSGIQSGEAVGNLGVLAGTLTLPIFGVPGSEAFGSFLCFVVGSQSDERTVLVGLESRQVDVEPDDRTVTALIESRQVDIEPDDRIIIVVSNTEED